MTKRIAAITSDGKVPANRIPVETRLFRDYLRHMPQDHVRRSRDNETLAALRKAGK